MEQSSSRICESESCSKAGILRNFTDYSDTARQPRTDVWLCEDDYIALMNQEPILTSWFKKHSGKEAGVVLMRSRWS
jgi:hypothetical protein